ncbi:MAG: hypothetical protein MK096_15125 [Oleiphilaceae bacterium]|nr:hypothetical protein [Oleiphilaceae bacterium]
MQKKLWSINALSNELGIDRRTLSKRLEDLTPAKEKKLSNRVEKQWYLDEVVKHLNASKKVKKLERRPYYRFSETELEEFTSETIKDFIAAEYVPKTIENGIFINMIVNGVADELGISKEKAVTAYKLACLGIIYATGDGFQDEDMCFKIGEDTMIQELGRIGNKAFAEKHFS